MTETKSEWTKDHPKAVGWWVCADGDEEAQGRAAIIALAEHVEANNG